MRFLHIRRSIIEHEHPDLHADVFLIDTHSGDITPRVMTLGDQPLKWFTHHYGTETALSKSGKTHETYGRLHPFKVNGRDLQLLPLVHPRQAVKLGSHSLIWADLHNQWIVNPPVEVLSS
jgi:hypothetical protein